MYIQKVIKVTLSGTKHTQSPYPILNKGLAPVESQRCSVEIEIRVDNLFSTEEISKIITDQINKFGCKKRTHSPTTWSDGFRSFRDTWYNFDNYKITGETEDIKVESEYSAQKLHEELTSIYKT